jgi:hypothetical protein
MTTTSATNQAVIYLPSNTYYGDVLDTNSWTTSEWTVSYDENGLKIIEQIRKLCDFMDKYGKLINGVIHRELIDQIYALQAIANEKWGFTTSTTYPTTWASSTTVSNDYNLWTTTNGTSTDQTINNWFTIDNP